MAHEGWRAGGPLTFPVFCAAKSPLLVVAACLAVAAAADIVMVDGGHAGRREAEGGAKVVGEVLGGSVAIGKAAAIGVVMVIGVAIAISVAMAIGVVTAIGVAIAIAVAAENGVAAEIGVATTIAWGQRRKIGWEDTMTEVWDEDLAKVLVPEVNPTMGTWGRLVTTA